MMAIDDSGEAGLIERILGEYREMPGLALTMDQARRLWGCDAVSCHGVIDVLVSRGVRRWSRESRLMVGAVGKKLIEEVLSIGTTQDEQLARYDAVIHLRTPALEHGYKHQNPLRTESATAAAEIDARILQVWQLHPRRFTVESSAEFFEKAARALEILRGELPECCKQHVISALRDHLTKPVGPDVGHART